MTECPDAEKLHDLIASNLADDESRDVERHLESCHACQAILDKQCDFINAIPGLRSPIASAVEADDRLSGERIRKLARAVRNHHSGEVQDSFMSDVETSQNDSLPAISGYHVQKELGRGGMGIVLKARHVRMQRDVAIKILSAASLQDEFAVDRFFREAQAAAALAHPNIVAAYDAGEESGMHYLVMEYVDGWNLDDVVKGNGPLDLLDAVECVVQVAMGLQSAHERGIIHRDIKPANLLLAREGVVKILDLGLASLNFSPANQPDRSAEGQLTGSGQIMGTVDYMAPEQALDTRQADHRCDIYSLGCTFFRLLTGKKMYDGNTLMKRILAHRENAVPSLNEFRSDIPPAVDAVFRKMVAKEADMRQQSMEEVIQGLQFLTAAAHSQDTSAG
ncbi:MAG: protein kinase [Planctomycetota bacterium]|nr:protein kinase [Planctomycetota bacterium]